MLLVRMGGIEPPPHKGLDPKSSASTSFATSADCTPGGTRTHTRKATELKTVGSTISPTRAKSIKH